MLKQLFESLRSGYPVSKVMQDLDDMVNLAEEMNRAAIRELIADEPLTIDVVAKDRDLNAMQQEIRRKVIRHLALNPKDEVLAYVTLVNVVIFVERLGDYAKNIHELKLALDGPFSEVCCSDALTALSEKVLDVFQAARRALSSEDEADARKVLDMHKMIGAESREVIDSLLRKKQTDDQFIAVAAMYARYLRRISAHLMNASSTVINAFDMIGYYPGKEGSQP